VLNRFKEQFSPYGSQVLDVVKRNGHLYSEPLEFLSQLVNGPHNHQFRPPSKATTVFTYTSLLS